MSEDDDYEELPMICVNSSVHDSSTFSMPSAEQLAASRARELECERELSLLRAGADLTRTDSSGSDTEAVLAAAVTGIAVATPPDAHYAPRAADLLHAFAAQLPVAARPLLQHPDAPRRLSELVDGVASAVAADEDVWSDEDVLSAGALLLCAVLAHDCSARAPALRALHALLDLRATEQQTSAVCRLSLSAVRCGRARLEMSDAVRSGAPAGADSLAATVLHAALTDLLDAPQQCEWSTLCASLCTVWRSLCPSDAYTALQLAGRRLGTAERSERAALLAAIAPAAHHHDAQRPDRLKVLVSASKLQLLFRCDQ